MAVGHGAVGLAAPSVSAYHSEPLALCQMSWFTQK